MQILGPSLALVLAVPAIFLAPRASAAQEEGAPPAPAAAVPTVSGSDLASLAPSDAFLVLRFESLDAVEGALRRLAELFAPDEAEELDLVAEMATELDVPEAALRLLDRGRPLGLALSLGSMMEPAATMLWPVADAQAFAAQVTLPPVAEARLLAADGYVVVTQLEAYAPSGGLPLAAELPDGIVAGRIDLASLVSTYRPILDSQLEMASSLAEMMMADPSMMPPGSMPPGLEGFDVQAIVDAWIDGAIAFLDSAERLELTADLEGDEAHVGFDLGVAEGSPMASLRWGVEGGPTLAALARRLAPGDPIQMVAAFDMAALMHSFEGFMELAISMYPPELRDSYAQVLAAQAQAYDLFGGGFAGGGKLDADGLAFAAYYASSQPEELLDVYLRTVEPLSSHELGMWVEDLQRTEIAGFPAATFRMQMDAAFVSKLGMPAGAAGPEVGAAGEEDGALPGEAASPLAAQQRILRLLFGEDGLRYAYAALPDGLAMVFGGDEAYAARTVAAYAAAEGAAPAPLATALARVGDRNPSLAFSMDVGALLEGMRPFLAEVQPTAADLPTELPSSTMSFYGAIDARNWTWGGTADVAGLARLVQAVEDR